LWLRLLGGHTRELKLAVPTLVLSWWVPTVLTRCTTPPVLLMLLLSLAIFNVVLLQG
jgi:hypothetical protein